MKNTLPKIYTTTGSTQKDIKDITETGKKGGFGYE